MGKKISVYRENDVEYLKRYLLEAVREVIVSEESFLTEAPDPEAIQQIEDWSKKSGLEVEQKKDNVLIIKVPPSEEDGKRRDARGPVVQQLEKDLAPLGFIYDSARGGTYGRFIKPGIRGQFSQLEVYVKPTVAVGGGGAAAAAGMDAEVKLASYISEKYASEGVSAKTAGAGHGSDLEIMASGKEPMTIEVKTSLGADFGQFRIRYDVSTKKWEPSSTKGFEKNKILFQDIFDTTVAPYMNKNAEFSDGELQNPSLQTRGDTVGSLKPLKGTGDFKKQLQNKWFGGSTDFRQDFDFIKISNYYSSKGDRFVQIGRGKGLYALTREDAGEMGVPFFGDAGLRGIVRVRIKPHGGYDGIHSFTVAIKIAGTLESSPLDLTREEDMDKIVDRFLKS